MLSAAFYVRNIVRLLGKRHQARPILRWYAGKYSNDISLYDWNIELKSVKLEKAEITLFQTLRMINYVTILKQNVMMKFQLILDALL